MHTFSVALRLSDGKQSVLILLHFFIVKYLPLFIMTKKCTKCLSHRIQNSQYGNEMRKIVECFDILQNCLSRIPDVGGSGCDNFQISKGKF